MKVTVTYGVAVDESGAAFTLPIYPNITAAQLARLIGNPLIEEEDMA